MYERCRNKREKDKEKSEKREERSEKREEKSERVTYLYNALSYNDAFIVSKTAVEKYSSHPEFSGEINFLRKIMKECRLSGN
ncbi:MAG: hypothetical protein KAT48_11845 [Bacteroidales bacterium]|nr:hypothetical protein [Bacteroidales bacterium]